MVGALGVLGVGGGWGASSRSGLSAAGRFLPMVPKKPAAAPWGFPQGELSLAKEVAAVVAMDKSSSSSPSSVRFAALAKNPGLSFQGSGLGFRLGLGAVEFSVVVVVVSSESSPTPSSLLLRLKKPPSFFHAELMLNLLVLPFLLSALMRDRMLLSLGTLSNEWFDASVLIEMEEGDLAWGTPSELVRKWGEVWGASKVGAAGFRRGGVVGRMEEDEEEDRWCGRPEGIF